MLGGSPVVPVLGSAVTLIPAVCFPLVAFPDVVPPSDTVRCTEERGVELADSRMGSTWDG